LESGIKLWRVKPKAWDAYLAATGRRDRAARSGREPRRIHATAPDGDKVMLAWPLWWFHRDDLEYAGVETFTIRNPSWRAPSVGDRVVHDATRVGGTIMLLEPKTPTLTVQYDDGEIAIHPMTWVGGGPDATYAETSSETMSVLRFELETMITRCQWRDIDDFLRTLPIGGVDVDVLLLILDRTQAHKQFFEEREAFVSRVEARMLHHVGKMLEELR